MHGPTPIFWADLTHFTLKAATFTIKYDLTSPYLTDAQRRILAWPSQWDAGSNI